MVKEYLKFLAFSSARKENQELFLTPRASRMLYTTEDYVSMLLWGIEKDNYVLNTFSAWPTQPSKAEAYPFAKGTLTELHENDTCELMYIVQGTLRKNIAGTDYVFREDDIVLLNEGILNFDHLDNEDTCILFLKISHPLFQQLYQAGIRSPYQNYIADQLLKPNANCSHISGTLKPQFSFENTKSALALQAVVQEITHPDLGSSHIIKGQLIRLFHNLILEYQFDISEHSQAEMNKLLYQEVVEYIRQNCRDISIEKLQQKYFFNRDYFNRLIKKYSGLTFRELRQYIRLEEAQRLLYETDARIEDIALAVGYKNLGFFYQLFYNKFKETPREYRLSQR